MPDFQDQRREALSGFGEIFGDIGEFIFEKGEEYAQKAEADPMSFKGLPFGAGEPRVIRGATSVMGIPFSSASAAVESYEKGEVVNTIADSVIAYGSLTGVGALFGAAFGQEEVEDAFEKWVEVGHSLKEKKLISAVTDLHPEISDLYDRAWELIPAILLHKSATKATKTKGLEVTPDGIREAAVDRTWVKDLKSKMDKIRGEAEKGDFTTLKETLSQENIKITESVYEAMKKETGEVLKIEDFKGESKGLDAIQEARIQNKMGSVEYVKMMAKER